MRFSGFIRSIAHGCLAQVVFNPLVMLSLGGVVVLIGGALVIGVRQDEARARVIESAEVLGTSAVGKTAVVEARISAQNPAVDGAMVAFVREAYRSCGDSSCWVEVARLTPPLLLDERERSVRIVNDDYEFGSTAHTVEESQPTLTEGAVRSRGFRAGDTMMVLGIAQSASQIDARTVYAGTTTEAVAVLRGGARAATLSGFAAAVGGLAWCGLGLVVLRRRLRD